MSLKAFHIFFITVCAALSVFMILWGFQSYRLSANRLGLEVGIVGIVVLLVLIPYSRWVRKKFQKINPAVFVAASLTAILHPLPSHACAVCFGDPNSAMTKGIKVGIVLLIVIVGGVLGGIASVAVSWARRARTLTRNLNP